MIRLNCFYTVKAGSEADAVAAAKRLTEASLVQDGCISYDVFESATRPGVFLICETWRDEAALAAHSASEPFAREVAILKDLGELKIEQFTK
ncbi:MAG: antibiotic biosynthesis monooxygenase [Kiritimatiellae bacterium]|nr:antibiotic biosynthesis monooxygenase [Kiritimatiellia bacterium]